MPEHSSFGESKPMVMKNMRRVVVTGMGAVTPVGNSVPEFWQNLLVSKRTAAVPITRFSTTDYKVRFACEVQNFDHNVLFTSPKEARKCDRVCWYALAAGREAWKDSGLDLTKTDAGRIGCIIGTGMGGLETMEDQISTMLEKGPSRISPFVIPKIIPNMPAGMVSIDLGIKGINYCACSACSSGAHAIGEAFRAVQHGQAEACICGGAEACLTRFCVAGFSNMMALSTRNDEPGASSRPFDKNRDGFVIGEGAGLIVLEELEHALARGAKIYAEMIGYGASGDAYHITAPDPDGDGGARGMQSALDDAGIQPEEVSYINAHGTSTPMNDRLETLAIKRVFKDYAYKLPISSTKSVTGHLLGAAAGLEAIVCVKSIMDGIVPPTVNITTPDPECDLDYVPDEPRKVDVRVAISNSLGFGGHNVTLAFKRYE